MEILISSHKLDESMPSQELLDEQERQRAEAFICEDARRIFIASRISLKRFLAGLLRVEPCSIHIDRATNGKPFLKGCPEFRFNQSHTDDLALAAVSKDFDLGVDVEKLEPSKYGPGMAEQMMSAGELAAFRHLDRDELKLCAFFRNWVRKEACLKALGTGFALSPKSFECGFDDDCFIQEVKITLDSANVPAPVQVLDLKMNGPYYAAVAWTVQSSLGSSRTANIPKIVFDNRLIVLPKPLG